MTIVSDGTLVKEGLQQVAAAIKELAIAQRDANDIEEAKFWGRPYNWLMQTRESRGRNEAREEDR